MKGELLVLDANHGGAQDFTFIKITWDELLGDNFLITIAVFHGDGIMKFRIKYGTWIGINWGEIEGLEGFVESFLDWGEEGRMSLDGTGHVVDQGEDLAYGSVFCDCFGLFPLQLNLFTEVFKIRTGALQVADQFRVLTG